MYKNIPQVLTIAGSDSGGGAGIQADLKTFQERRVFGMSVITAITAQNTLGVNDVHLIPTAIIAAQLAAIADDFSPKAFKIGMLGNADIIHCVAEGLREHSFGIGVIDPVMIAKGGAPLLEPSAIEALKQVLLPLADVITPNIPEAEFLTGVKIDDQASARQAADQLRAMGVKTVIIKGGHGNGQASADLIVTEEGEFLLSAPRIQTRHTHGTGCTFSACIAAELAKEQSIEAATRTAKAFITAAITQTLDIGQGHGPTNHWAYADSEPSESGELGELGMMDNGEG